MIMPMSGNLMGTAVATAITDTDAPPEVQAEVLKLWQTICTEIVNHITLNALVAPGIPVKTAGTPVEQTGATTAPGKIT